MISLAGTEALVTTNHLHPVLVLPSYRPEDLDDLGGGSIGKGAMILSRTNERVNELLISITQSAKDSPLVQSLPP